MPLNYGYLLKIKSLEKFNHIFIYLKDEAKIIYWKFIKES